MREKVVQKLYQNGCTNIISHLYSTLDSIQDQRNWKTLCTRYIK